MGVGGVLHECYNISSCKMLGREQNQHTLGKQCGARAVLARGVSQEGWQPCSGEMCAMPPRWACQDRSLGLARAAPGLRKEDAGGRCTKPLSGVNLMVQEDGFSLASGLACASGNMITFF